MKEIELPGQFELPEPFLGRLILEAIETDLATYINEKRGVNEKESPYLKNSGFTVIQAETVLDEYEQAKSGKSYKISKSGSIPTKKGIVIKMSPDAFGSTFQSRYGEDVGNTPKIGDTVMFIPGQSHRLDLEEKYHMISDEDVLAVYPKKEETTQPTLKTEEKTHEQ